MPELRRLTLLDGTEWIVFQDVCTSLSIPHPHLAIGLVPLAHRTQSTVMAADGTRSYEWLIDDIGANSLAAQQDRSSSMNPQKRSRRARTNRAQGEEHSPTPKRRSRVAQPQPRKRRTLLPGVKATTYTEAASLPLVTEADAAPSEPDSGGAITAL